MSQSTETPSTVGDLVDPNGNVWQNTGETRNGAALYVPDHVDPAKCPKLVMSTRMELESIFGTELHPVGDAA